MSRNDRTRSAGVDMKAVYTELEDLYGVNPEVIRMLMSVTDRFTDVIVNSLQLEELPTASNTWDPNESGRTYGWMPDAAKECEKPYFLWNDVVYIATKGGAIRTDWTKEDL